MTPFDVAVHHLSHEFQRLEDALLVFMISRGAPRIAAARGRFGIEQASSYGGRALMPTPTTTAPWSAATYGARAAMVHICGKGAIASSWPVRARCGNARRWWGRWPMTSRGHGPWCGARRGEGGAS